MPKLCASLPSSAALIVLYANAAKKSASSVRGPGTQREAAIKANSVSGSGEESTTSPNAQTAQSSAPEMTMAVMIHAVPSAKSNGAGSARNR